MMTVKAASVLCEDDNKWGDSVQDYIVGDQVLVSSDGRVCYFVALPGCTNATKTKLSAFLVDDDTDLTATAKTIAFKVGKLL